MLAKCEAEEQGQEPKPDSALRDLCSLHLPTLKWDQCRCRWRLRVPHCRSNQLHPDHLHKPCRVHHLQISPSHHNKEQIHGCKRGISRNGEPASDHCDTVLPAYKHLLKICVHLLADQDHPSSAFTQIRQRSSLHLSFEPTCLDKECDKLSTQVTIHKAMGSLSVGWGF